MTPPLHRPEHQFDLNLHMGGAYGSGSSHGFVIGGEANFAWLDVPFGVNAFVHGIVGNDAGGSDVHGESAVYTGIAPHIPFLLGVSENQWHSGLFRLGVPLGLRWTDRGSGPEFFVGGQAEIQWRIDWWGHPPTLAFNIMGLGLNVYTVPYGDRSSVTGLLTLSLGMPGVGLEIFRALVMP